MYKTYKTRSKYDLKTFRPISEDTYAASVYIRSVFFKCKLNGTQASSNSDPEPPPLRPGQSGGLHFDLGFYTCEKLSFSTELATAQTHRERAGEDCSAAEGLRELLGECPTYASKTFMEVVWK